MEPGPEVEHELLPFAPQAHFKPFGGICRGVYRSYWNEFWRWPGMDGAHIVACSCGLEFADQQIRTIFSSGPRGAIHSYWGEIDYCLIRNGSGSCHPFQAPNPRRRSRNWPR